MGSLAGCDTDTSVYFRAEFHRCDGGNIKHIGGADREPSSQASRSTLTCASSFDRISFNPFVTSLIIHEIRPYRCQLPRSSPRYLHRSPVSLSSHYIGRSSFYKATLANGSRLAIFGSHTSFSTRSRTQIQPGHGSNGSTMDYGEMIDSRDIQDASSNVTRCLCISSGSMSITTTPLSIDWGVCHQQTPYRSVNIRRCKPHAPMASRRSVGSRRS